MQTSNGAVACQLLDVLRPGQVPLSKVSSHQDDLRRCMVI